MQGTEHHRCECLRCREEAEYPEREHHREINLLMSQLPHAQRRIYAAIESKRLGRGGCQSVSEITGLSASALSRGRLELAALLAGTPLERPKGQPGRRSIEEKYPEIKSVLETLVADGTGGNPMTHKKWVRISSRKLSKELGEKGYTVNYHTICDLLNSTALGRVPCASFECGERDAKLP